jgi:hypothetical protein
MATKYFCDVCGAETPTETTSYILPIHWPPTYQWSDRDYLKESFQAKMSIIIHQYRDDGTTPKKPEDFSLCTQCACKFFRLAADELEGWDGRL